MCSCRASIPLGGPATPAKARGLGGMLRQDNPVDQLSFHDPSLSSTFSSEKQFQSSYAYIIARSNLAQLLKNNEQAITSFRANLGRVQTLCGRALVQKCLSHLPLPFSCHLSQLAGLERNPIGTPVKELC